MSSLHSKVTTLSGKSLTWPYLREQCGPISQPRQIVTGNHALDFCSSTSLVTSTSQTLAPLLLGWKTFTLTWFEVILTDDQSVAPTSAVSDWEVSSSDLAAIQFHLAVGPNRDAKGLAWSPSYRLVLVDGSCDSRHSPNPGPGKRRSPTLRDKQQRSIWSHRCQ